MPRHSTECLLVLAFGYLLGASTIRFFSFSAQSGDIPTTIRSWSEAPHVQPPPPAPPAPRLIERMFDGIAAEARHLLEEGSKADARSPDGSVFGAVKIALPLSPPLIEHCTDWDSGGQGNKNIVGGKWMPKHGGCVVYGVGIADESGFEREMAEKGCETHAFDCTISADSKPVVGMPFKFHPWCIGKNTAESAEEVADTSYGQEGKKVGASFTFKPLNVTMRELGHSRVDLLKFDIEGFEWELMETQILGNPEAPDQLSFELHTDKANPSYVPHKNVAGKHYQEVNRLFLRLFDMGYRVVSKEINFGDPACAEFVVVRR